MYISNKKWLWLALTDAYNSQFRYNIAECEGGSEEEKSDGERSFKATKTTAKENRPSKEEGMRGVFHIDMFVMSLWSQT